MNRIKFNGLIIMMLLSIIGIIWVQIVWIRNAVGIQNDSFNTAVSVCLSNAANAIESSRKMNFFNNFMLAEPFSLNDPSNDVTGYLSIGSYASEPGNKISVKTNSRAVYIRQNEFLDWLKKRSSEFQNMSNQMISEIFQMEKTMELDFKEIDFNLKRSLAYSGIQTPFEYAIIKDGLVQNGTFKKAQKNDFLKSKYMVRLFPDNIIQQDLILSLIFPERANYVLGSMMWILGGSMLFSLFILATFALSLFFIIRQNYFRNCHF